MELLILILFVYFQIRQQPFFCVLFNEASPPGKSGFLKEGVIIYILIRKFTYTKKQDYLRQILSGLIPKKKFWPIGTIDLIENFYTLYYVAIKKKRNEGLLILLQKTMR